MPDSQAPKAANSNGVSRNLDTLDYTKLGKGLILFHPQLVDIEHVLTLASLDVPEVASVETVRKLVVHNPDCLWAISRNNDREIDLSAPDGLIGMLPLTEEGHRALFDGRLDTLDPDLQYVARQWETPSALYIWGIWAPGRISAGVSLMMERLRSPKYADAPMYCQAASEHSRRFFLTLGFGEGTSYGGHFRKEVMHYIRNPHLEEARTAPAAAPVVQSNVPVSAQAQAPKKGGKRRHENRQPAYDSYPGKSAAAGSDKLTVTAARTLDEIMQVFAIRSATYMSEQECPYDEEFDGNDFCGAHLIGYVGSEPAGCLRIRYFSGFAKVERLAVRAEFRRSRLAFELVKAAVELCRKKGYTRIIGHSQKRLVNFWRMFGAKNIETRPDFRFSDMEYVEMNATFDPDQDAILENADPYVMLRPEGRWHLPGILEASADRPSANDNEPEAKGKKSSTDAA